MPRPKEETYILIRQAQGGNEEARGQLVTENAGLVKKIAAKFVSDEHEMEDLVQIGYMGLLKAIDRFCLEYDVMFSTYAVPMIMGELKRFLRDHGRLKVSRGLKADMNTLRQLEETFEMKEGRKPRISEIAERMHVPVERVLEIMEAGNELSSVVSLDQQPVAFAEERQREYDCQERQVDLLMMKDEIAALPEKEKAVIYLRYFKDFTQQQIAKRMGISQVQVSRIEKKALGKIRENMMEK